ncbi:Vacuolar protein-sorting-associated protein 27, partial [Lunasporangiospora selenospora]
MSWLWSISPIDELIDKATSENLPAGTDDLALNLEICDQIRSKRVSPKDAAKALKRRISHKNPNVQLLALGLTDVCAKNGGQHLLVEVTSRDFVDNLTSILRAPAGCSPVVKTRILALIQTWGLLFRGKPGLGYVCDTYAILQQERYEFPPVDQVGAAIVETLAAPDWTDSDVCTRCRTTFTLTNRKHHCRACGSTFCGQCSTKSMALPDFGITQEVRVCDGCYLQSTRAKKPASGVGSGTVALAATVPTLDDSRQPNSASNNGGSSSTQEDEDIRKAIELSLKEANSRPGYSEPSTKTIEHNSTGPALGSTGQRQSPYEAYTYSKEPEVQASTASTEELTTNEKDNIEMFLALLEKLQTTQGDVHGNQEIQGHYDQILKLQPKVSQGLEEVSKKQQAAVEYNEKIDQAVRTYDRLLQDRLHAIYQRRIGAYTYGSIGLQQSQQPFVPQAPDGLYGNMSQPPVNPHFSPQPGGDTHFVRFAPEASVAPSDQASPNHPAAYLTQSIPQATAPILAPTSQVYAYQSEFGVAQAPVVRHTQEPFYSSEYTSPALTPGHPGQPLGFQQPQVYAHGPGVPIAAPTVPVDEKPLIELSLKP